VERWVEQGVTGSCKRRWVGRGRVGEAQWAMGGARE